MVRRRVVLVVLVFLAVLLGFCFRESAEEAPGEAAEAPGPTLTTPWRPRPAPAPTLASQDASSPQADSGAVMLARDAGGADAALTLDAGPSLVPDPGEVAPRPLVFALDAGPRTRNDPRFTIRWGQAGLCGEEPLEHLAQRRATLLASFTGVRRAGALIFYDPAAPLDFVDQVGDSIAQARIIVTRLLGPRADAPLPVIYVYASADQMRDVACVNTATAGYYDGAIHLPATDPDARRTVIHEHVHHVLNSFGLRKPMWLHEGLAMYAADERWWEDARLGLTTWLRTRHLPFPSLVEAFPHTADELFAGAAYYQSYQMVSFVGARSGRTDFFWLVDGLVSGSIGVQTSFEESAGLSGDSLESAWTAFIQSR